MKGKIKMTQYRQYAETTIKRINTSYDMTLHLQKEYGKYKIENLLNLHGGRESVSSYMTAKEAHETLSAIEKALYIYKRNEKSKKLFKDHVTKKLVKLCGAREREILNNLSNVENVTINGRNFKKFISDYNYFYYDAKNDYITC